MIRAEYNLPAATTSQLIREEAEVEAEADAVAGGETVIKIPAMCIQANPAGHDSLAD